jgi:hypothetical protein
MAALALVASTVALQQAAVVLPTQNSTGFKKNRIVVLY